MVDKIIIIISNVKHFPANKYLTNNATHKAQRYVSHYI